MPFKKGSRRMAADSPLYHAEMRRSLFLLDVLEAVERNGDENDQAGEHELQVGINTQNGQCVGKSGKDQHTDGDAGNLADTAGEGNATNNARGDSVHLPALAVSSGARTDHADALEPRTKAVQDTGEDEGADGDSEDVDTGDGSSLGLPPTANMFLPKVVLFQMNHTTTIAATAHRTIVGKPPIRGVTMAGIRGSIEPKDTPLVA